MTKHRYLALLGLCLSLGLLHPTPAGATEVLDQSQTISQSPTNVYNDYPKAQIFTAGQYGSLDRVSLRLENFTASPPAGAFLTISIQTVIGGLPSGIQIGSGAIPLSAIPPPGNPDWVDVDITGALVTAGTQYALVLRPSSTFGSIFWWYAYNTGYAGGAMAANAGTGWTVEDRYDFTFQTYVVLDVLDQWQHATTDRIGVGLQFMAGQTFTAGLSGVIDRVVVLLDDADGTSPIEASIQTLKEGLPSGRVLGQGSIPASSVPPVYSEGRWVTIGISGAPVTVGTKYALVLRDESGQVMWLFSMDNIYAGGDMLHSQGSNWTKTVFSSGPADTAFETYIVQPVASAPPPPPATITPCTFGVCPAFSASVTPTDSTARVTSNIQFRELPDGTVRGNLNFNDSKAANFMLQGCTTNSAACRLTVTTFACTDEHEITVAGTYTPKGETAGVYLLTLSGARGGIGTFTLTAGHYAYTLTHDGIVDVTCPPGAGFAAGQR